MPGGRASRQKGDRGEREFAKLMGGERVPLSGSQGGKFKGDVDVPYLGRGAGKAQGKTDIKSWYQANRDKMVLHPETRAWVEAHLGEERDQNEMELDN